MAGRWRWMALSISVQRARFHRTNLPDLYAGLTKLLPDETVKQLDAVYKNPQATTRAIMEALVEAFPRGRTVVLLDNFEDVLAVETGQIKDAELDEALRALLELPPHGLKIIITTRVAPATCRWCSRACSGGSTLTPDWSTRMPRTS